MPSISVSTTASCTPDSPVTCIGAAAARVSALSLMLYCFSSIALRISLTKLCFFIVFLLCIFLVSSVSSFSSSSSLGSSSSYERSFSSNDLSSAFLLSISSRNDLNSFSSSSVISRTSVLQSSTISFALTVALEIASRISTLFNCPII